MLNFYWLRIILFFRLLAFNVAGLCKKTTQKQTNLRKLDEKRQTRLRKHITKQTYFAV